MKTKILSYFAAFSVVSAILGIAFNRLEIALFGMAVSSLLLLIAATDYAPRRTYSRVLTFASAGKEQLPLAV